ncbi:type IV pilus secretin PilQ/competence protein [Methylophilaceae bacterium 11]|uniref:type IV pilus secretin PilQ n=1 Tax=Methylotenera sp. 1P/1 TaxID=1131551 RepID=UPI0003773474|nr:type IV pilus secretin PilQ [Methylotenera sp. 1P/1]EUJ11554.1 type IV pilus secretin PilQ/competence protein [Methylophilaceae bacterium 11]
MKHVEKLNRVFLAFVLLISQSLFHVAFAAESNSLLTNEIESVDFTSLSGGRVNIRVVLKSPLEFPPPGFSLNSPARIALDFPKTANGLNKSNIVAEQGALKSVSLAQAKDRTRMVLNLSKSVGYNTSVNGKEVVISLQGSETAANNTVAETRFAEGRSSSAGHAIANVDFARGKNGEGRIIVELSDASSGINIKNKGKTIVVDFVDTDVPAELQRRLNVINFNTPVLYIDTIKRGKNGQIIIEPKGDWEQSAYQADKKFIVDVRPIIQDPNKLVQGSKIGFAGEKLSLNFQNIEVRSVLQVIADFTGKNIVASDSVTGNITLRLKDVPWDQALDIIMKNKGLDKRVSGNVISIAPADELAAKEKAALEANQAIEDLEPLRTEVFTLKYQKAENFKKILSGDDSGGNSGDKNKSILSKRGSAVWDPRTNTLFIQDTARKLEEIQSVINKIDIPVKQVMIESRLVIADDKFAKSLGARFGVTQTGTPGSATATISGSLGNRFTQSSATTLTQGTHNGSIQTATDGGNILTSSDGLPDLMSNLPVANAFGSFALSLFKLSANTLLNLELSALESDKRGKVVSSPRVTTANQQKASIASGTKIPYLQASSSGATNISFIDATLSLDVTPQITPDEKIIMELEVKKDRVGQVFFGTPSIDTQNVKTNVLVANGETAVLGGIYEQTERNDVDKVPFFGDLPIVGHAFKRRTKQEDKTELLIFITPKIMDESLGLR